MDWLILNKCTCTNFNVDILCSYIDISSVVIEIVVKRDDKMNYFDF